MSANRALFRWGWRALRRDWRQQLLVLSLISVAAAVGFTAVIGASNIITPNENIFGIGGDARYRNAAFVSDDLESDLDISPTDDLERSIIAARDQVEAGGGSVAFIRHATTEELDLEAVSMDPSEKVTEPFITLVDGQYPQKENEVAVTAEVFEEIFPNETVSKETLVKQNLDFSLAGNSFAVVGIVENPAKLEKEFVLFQPGFDFAQFDISHLGVDAYIDTGGNAAVRNYFESYFTNRSDSMDRAGVTGWMPGSETGGEETRDFVVFLISIIFVVGMIQISLLSSAAFAAIGQKRIRQFGILGSVGAPPAYVRRAVAFNGLAVGCISVLIGGTIAFILLPIVLPFFEPKADHRIAFGIDLRLALSLSAVTVLLTTFAAWWPSLSLSKLPLADALGSRVPKPRKVKFLTAAGVVVAISGAFILSSASFRGNTIFAGAGILLAILGAAAISPLFAKLSGQIGTHLPIAGRIATRDISRHQARSAVGISAVVISLAISLVILIPLSSMSKVRSINVPDLPDEYLRIMPYQESGDSMSAEAERFIRNELPEAEIFPMTGISGTKNKDLGNKRVGYVSDFPADKAQYEWHRGIVSTDIWVVTPEVENALEITIPEDTEAKLFTWTEKPLFWMRGSGPIRQEGEGSIGLEQQQIDLPQFREFSAALVTAETAAKQGWETETVAWLVKNDEPISSSTVRRIETNMPDEFGVSAPRDLSVFTNLRRLAIVLGALASLFVTTLVVTLIRGESASDLRTLTAIGASSNIRRTISAVTAVSLTASGAILAVPLGYLSLIVMRADGNSYYPFVVPWQVFAFFLLAVPVLAASLASVFSGKEPLNLARRE